MRSNPGGNTNATWSPVLIFALSSNKQATRSARLWSWEQVIVVDTVPFELRSVKMTWSAVEVDLHLRISEINWYFLAVSESSSTTPRSLPWADASRFPWTMFPTITLAGPTSEWISLGFGKLVTQVCGHKSTFAGWRVPSKKRRFV